MGSLIKFTTSLPLIGLRDGNKNIRFINKRMRRGRGRVRRLPNRVEIFKRLLGNKVNKANIDRSKRKRKQKGKSFRIHPRRLEIFR